MCEPGSVTAETVSHVLQMGQDKDKHSKETEAEGYLTNHRTLVLPEKNLQFLEISLKVHKNTY